MGPGKVGSKHLEFQLGDSVACTDELLNKDVPLSHVALCGPVLVGVQVVCIYI